VWLASAGLAQGTAADYERSAAVSARWRGKLRAFRPALHWLEGGRQLAFRVTGADGGFEFVRVTADGDLVKSATAADIGIELPVRLSPRRDQGRSPGLRRRSVSTTVRFENRLDRKVRLFWIDRRGRSKPYGEIEPGEASEQSTFAGHVWLADYEANDLVGIFEATQLPGLAVFDDASRKLARERRGQQRSERRSRPVFVRDANLWYRGAEADERRWHRLTEDGTSEDAYRDRVHLSPDGARVLAFQVERGERHEVHMVESRPEDQVQPKLQTIQYRKPGDRIDRSRPRLFDLGEMRRIEVDGAPFAEPWSIGRVHWAADGSEVFLLHNRRGHQALTVFAIDAVTGAVRAVLEERSDTFVDYSQKTYLHWLEGGDAFLWMSERSGFNHLYRVDAKTGAMRQLTKGDWLVRSVEIVDEEGGEIWFTAMGIHPDQDPYHRHLARVDFDGGNLTVLTEADGTHSWEVSPDRSLLVARWSRVDHPEVTELRDARDGSLVAELGRDDASELLAAGFRPPIRFVAKGRDGVTDIWGIIIQPSNFDPSRRYPVIESIYAGPHGHHVPKGWGLNTSRRPLAELGFVVVQIDGMGTNWRSKAFHDVCWRNLKDAGLPDRIAWLRAAAAKYPSLDISRVGIYGGSAGGQNALAALLHHGDFYKVAAADCGCHDNRMDKIWWNEAWMGWPVGPWYADSSNVTHAAKLVGKLLLTVGELDRNVDPASTMQVVGALIEADKDFDLVVVPGAGHGVGESRYLKRRRQDFFVRHLLDVEPRSQ